MRKRFSVATHSAGPFLRRGLKRSLVGEWLHIPKCSCMEEELQRYRTELAFM